MEIPRRNSLASEILSGSLVSVYKGIICLYWYQANGEWQHRRAPKNAIRIIRKTKQTLNRVKHGQLAIYNGSNEAAEEVWKRAAALEYYTASKQDKCPKCGSETIEHNNLCAATGECSACNIYWDEN